MVQYEVYIAYREGKFGKAIDVLKQNPFTGKKEHLTYGVGGEEIWTEIDPLEVVEKHTIIGDPDLLGAIADAWIAQHPKPEPDPTKQEILESAVYDARGTRDRTLSMLEDLIKTDRITMP